VAHRYGARRGRARRERGRLPRAVEPAVPRGCRDLRRLPGGARTLAPPQRRRASRRGGRSRALGRRRRAHLGGCRRAVCAVRSLRCVLAERRLACPRTAHEGDEHRDAGEASHPSRTRRDERSHQARETSGSAGWNFDRIGALLHVLQSWQQGMSGRQGRCGRGWSADERAERGTGDGAPCAGRWTQVVGPRARKRKARSCRGF